MKLFTFLFWQAVLTFEDLTLTEPQTFEELVLDA
jgi:hypothetical protein